MTTQARSSYLPSEIIWGHRFQSAVKLRESGQYEVKYMQRKFRVYNLTYYYYYYYYRSIIHYLIILTMLKHHYVPQSNSTN